MKKKKFGVVVFPGSNCDADCLYVLKDVMGQPAEFIWHKSASLGDVEAVVLPGGFSYGDYLRTGAIARFSPVMNAVVEFAKTGRPVIGICNGFQILLEAGLLEGAMLRNRSLAFVCKTVELRVENAGGTFANRLRKGEVLRIPIAHGEGNYYADPATIDRLKQENRIVLRYIDNPNGSMEDIAGIVNRKGNVFGLMPHPERSSESALGSEDGRKIFESILQS